MSTSDPGVRLECLLDDGAVMVHAVLHLPSGARRPLAIPHEDWPALAAALTPVPDPRRYLGETDAQHPMRDHVRESNLIEDVHDEQAITDSLQAWEYLATQPVITRDVILETHRLVMHRIWPEIAGKLRTVGVMVGGRVCPSHRDVPVLLDSWVQRVTSYPTTLGPVREHVQFEQIHPFRDGNGRVGRLLLWCHQTRLGQAPQIIRYADRLAYYDWFSEESP